MIIVNDACVKMIKSFEGLSLKAYHGAADKPGIDTIGYGSIQYPPDYMQGKMVKIGDPDITEVQAESFLKWEIDQKTKAIDLLLRDDLSPNQFAALISFTYNLGEGALKQSTLRLKVNANPNDPTIRAEFGKWVNSNGKKVAGLIRRRQAEADLYFTA
jgi:lysozyme